MTDDYKVRFVPAQMIPGGALWTMCTQGGTTVLYISEAACLMSLEEKEKALESAWAGFRALEARALVPAQR